ncbi:MAG: hypothetical protein IJS65_08645, partial [Clostridia bacterium]|nr:hypothetical protein [Clostridia bacterium]
LPPADADAQTNPTPDAADDTAPDPSPDPAPSENPAPQVAGGWQKAESPSLTDKQYEVFDKAMSAYEGESKYVPFAYLASQVVAGVNHRFLCLTPGMQSEFNREYAYSVVTVYEDLKGGAVITDVLDSGYFINFAEMPGGWSGYGPSMDEYIKTSFEKAAKAQSLSLKPVALCAEQVVGGMNYLVFCEDGPSYAFANLFLDNYGNAEISGVSRVS